MAILSGRNARVAAAAIALLAISLLARTDAGDERAASHGSDARAAAVAQALRRPADAARYGSRYRPFTPAWLDHCLTRYASFDPATGTYRTHSGERAFCRAEPHLSRPGY